MTDCTYQPGPPDLTSVVGVSAEVHMLPGREFAAVAFLNEVASWGAATPRIEVECAKRDSGHFMPVPAFFPAFLRAGTCAAGWCSASNRSERSGGTIELLVGLRERMDGEWHFAPLSDGALQRLAARGARGSFRAGRPVAAVWRRDEPPDLVVVPDPERTRTAREVYDDVARWRWSLREDSP